MPRHLSHVPVLSERHPPDVAAIPSLDLTAAP
jgi:hypothetical protein